jgi:hypothetical protein
MGDPVLLAGLLSLLGVVVGGLITFLTGQVQERRRHRHERREKLDALRREALSAALEWIEPMREAHIQASSLISAALHGGYADGEENILSKWPSLLDALAEQDLPGHQRAVLPRGLEASAWRRTQTSEQKNGRSRRWPARRPQSQLHPIGGIVGAPWDTSLAGLGTAGKNCATALRVDVPWPASLCSCLTTIRQQDTRVCITPQTPQPSPETDEPAPVWWTPGLCRSMLQSPIRARRRAG